MQNLNAVFCSFFGKQIRQIEGVQPTPTARRGRLFSRDFFRFQPLSPTGRGGALFSFWAVLGKSKGFVPPLSFCQTNPHKDLKS